MELEIIPFEPSHLEPVVALSLRAWQPVFDSLRKTLEPDVFSVFYPDWRTVQRHAVIEACTASDHETWVAALDGMIVGFVNVTRRDEVLGEIHMIAVDPAHQGEGIGTRLIDRAVERLRAQGLSIAMVETGSDPGHCRARRTYEAAGFRPFPVTRYFRKL